jgi:hypothetical protein
VSISSTFAKQLFCQYSFVKKIQGQTAMREKLLKAFLYEKGTLAFRSFFSNYSLA